MEVFGSVVEAGRQRPSGLWLDGPHDMATHMKTTVEISDALLAEAKALAERDSTTLRALIEVGLRHVVAESKMRKRRIPPRIVTFQGEGLRPEVGSFEDMLDLTYAGRGG